MRFCSQLNGRRFRIAKGSVSGTFFAGRRNRVHAGKTETTFESCGRNRKPVIVEVARTCHCDSLLTEGGKSPIPYSAPKSHCHCKDDDRRHKTQNTIDVISRSQTERLIYLPLLVTSFFKVPQKVQGCSFQNIVIDYLVARDYTIERQQSIQVSTVDDTSVQETAVNYVAAIVCGE